MRRRSMVLAVLALAAMGTACDDDARAGRDIGRYVAIGDSYTAGAGTGTPVAGPGAACGQVRSSYPRIVAREVAAELTDVSCAGARTDNATQPQPGADDAGWPPQLDALDEETDLVTVGLGYNDDGFFFDALFACTSLGGSDPAGAPCRDQHARTGPDGPTATARIGENLAAVLAQVQERAPYADVLVVGYPQPVPAEGSCAELPLAAGDYPFVRDRLELLDDAMRRAAEDTGATFVDVMSASVGHDVCAGEDAWVNGPEARAGLAAAYHPFASEQRAVADLVVAALRG